ncbi:hypothetical protein Hanom_Chr07g00676131 [Helianthus anomalus]
MFVHKVKKAELPFKLTKKTKIPLTLWRKTNGVNESDENGKISNPLDPMRKDKPLNESRKTGQTSGTKMAFYSI